MFAFSINFVVVCFEISIPLLLNQVIKYMEAEKGEDGGIWVGIGFISAWIIASSATKILNEQAVFYQGLLGDRSYGGLVAVIYNKTLRVSPATNKQFSQGEMINFMQVDAEKLADIAWCFPPVARLPVQLIFSLTFLFYFFSYYLFVAFGIGGALVILNYFFAKWNANIQDKALERKDKRMNTTTEVVNNIKIIKLNSWKKYFIDKVYKLRNRELSTIRKGLCVNSFEIISSWIMSPYMVLSIFSVYFLTGNSMSLSNSFSCLHVIYSLDTPIRWIPQFIGVLMEFLVSMRRIEKFLICDEVNPELVDDQDKKVINDDVDILITNANFSWGGKKEYKEDEDSDDEDSKVCFFTSLI